MLRIVYKRKFYYAASLILFIAAVVALSIWGLKPGIDFTGGSLMEVSFQNLPRPNSDQIRDALTGLDLGEIVVQPTGNDGAIIKFKTVDEGTHQQALQKLNAFIPAAANNGTDAGKPVAVELEPVSANQPVEISAVETVASADSLVVEKNFQSIGPSVSQELKTKTFYAIVIVLLAIITYIGLAFRKVGRPVASWKYGLIAVVALVHDVTITVGVFAVLGHYLNVEVDVSFVAAVLTVLGFSVHDTIVIFDRVRENLRRYQGDFEETVNKSLNETIVRSINTTFVTLLSLIAVFVFGGASIKYFALALIIGISAGAYSSIFLAAPGLVTWFGFEHKRAK